MPRNSRQYFCRIHRLGKVTRGLVQRARLCRAGLRDAEQVASLHSRCHLGSDLLKDWQQARHIENIRSVAGQLQNTEKTMAQFQGEQ